MAPRWFFVALLVAHGLIHLIGFAKGFGLTEFEGLTRPITRASGALWLAAGLGLVGAAALLAASHPAWWAVALAGAALSQVVIVGAWPDAKFGTVANSLVLAGAIYGCASVGPPSFRAAYLAAVGARAVAPGPPVTEADLASLPEPVQRYLRATGSVGRPRVTHVQARWKGRIRGAEDEPWMDFTADQHNFTDEPARFFHMRATRSGLPVDVLHAFSGDTGSMRVRLLSLIPVADARGPEFDRSETVTLLNDLCLLAPSALLGPGVQCEPIDAHTARVRYTVGAETVDATLAFDAASGQLVDFVSDDRMAASPDGAHFTQKRWSTPVSDYRDFDGRRIFTRGEGRWHGAAGAFTYIELELLEYRLQ